VVFFAFEENKREDQSSRELSKVLKTFCN